VTKWYQSSLPSAKKFSPAAIFHFIDATSLGFSGLSNLEGKIPYLVGIRSQDPSQIAMSIIKTRSQDHLDRAAEEASILEAAQAQARAEEEIGARLPCEVLNINRRLDLHQALVDKISGDLSLLTDMVQ
jgi:hypothetical protein